MKNIIQLFHLVTYRDDVQRQDDARETLYRIRFELELLLLRFVDVAGFQLDETEM